MRVNGINSELTTNNYKQKKPAFKRNWSEHISWGANYVKETGKTNFKLFSFPDAKAVFVEVADKLCGSMGNLSDRLVSIIAATGVTSAFSTIDDMTDLYSLDNKGNGIFEANDIDAKPGDNYRYVVVTKDNNVNLVKDPYSKYQKSILGWSSIYDQDSYKWQNTDWLDGKDSRRIIRKPNEPLRGLENLIIEEVNIPTLTKEGTYEAAKSRIDIIADKGFATAIELMPVENAFSKQWGYDGVDKFAPNSSMGEPDKLKELIDYAHGKGLNVIIDMVPNHMGPDGDFLSLTGNYIKGPGEFGNLLNYEGEHSRYVRDWMVNAALWWANEYKADGLRFDLTNPKYTGSDYLLRQITHEVNEHNPDVFLIAEDHEKNRHKITSYYNNPNATHNEEVEYVDSMIDALHKGWKNEPWSLGFDSEWDSVYRETFQKAVSEKDSQMLEDIDKCIDRSHYRVKYVFSHDEIGNSDGTRHIPKALGDILGLYYAVDGPNDSIKGQRAAQVAQKLSELIVSEGFGNMSIEELKSHEAAMGLNRFIAKQQLIDAFNGAFAKQKLAFGTIMTTPGPKMFFQGDDEADLSHFKFFRELSGDKFDRSLPSFNLEAHINQKGYDQLESVARPDSVIGRVKPAGMFGDMQTKMLKFSKDLRTLFDSMPVMQKGEIFAKYKDHNHKIHSHLLKLGDEELLVIKNYGENFHDRSYGYFGFPQGSNWEEVFNSDSTKYGGLGYTNSGRSDINNMNQNLSLAPNSFIILRKIK